MEGLTIVQIVRVFFEDLHKWTTERGGLAYLARDAAEPYELIAGMGPNDFRTVVSWSGDDEFGGNPRQHLDRHKIEIWIGRSRGLAKQPGDQLVYQDGKQSALLALVDDAKQRVLSIEFPREVTKQFVIYVGTAPVTTPVGIPMAAYKITVTLDAAGRDIAYRPVNI